MVETVPFVDIGEFILEVWVPCLVAGAIFPAFGSLIAAGIRAALRAMGMTDTDS